MNELAYPIENLHTRGDDKTNKQTNTATMKRKPKQNFPNIIVIVAWKDVIILQVTIKKYLYYILTFVQGVG